MFQDYNDYGRSWRKTFKRIVKMPTKVIKRASKMTVGTVKALSRGDIKTAGRNLMTLANPVSAVTSVVTDNKKLLDLTRMTMPTSVVSIEDRDLRKKAALGYAAAAIVAGGIFAAGAGAAGAGAGATGTAGAGATGTAGTLAKLAKDAKSATDLMALGKTLLNKEGEPEGQERAGSNEEGQVVEKEMQDKGKGILKYTIVGGSVLGILGIGYYLYKTVKEA